MSITIRPARPEDAATLVALGAMIGREPEAWLLNTDGWRSVTEERRYIRALKRHPDAAVFVAEDDGAIVGRLSVARDPHQASRHVADLGIMVAIGHRGQGIGLEDRRFDGRSRRLIAQTGLKVAVAGLHPRGDFFARGAGRDSAQPVGQLVTGCRFGDRRFTGGRQRFRF